MAFDVDLFGQSPAEKVISMTLKRKATAQKMAFEFTPLITIVKTYSPNNFIG
jgi:hypothetical protein